MLLNRHGANSNNWNLLWTPMNPLAEDHSSVGTALANLRTMMPSSMDSRRKCPVWISLHSAVAKSIGNSRAKSLTSLSAFWVYSQCPYPTKHPSHQKNFRGEISSSNVACGYAASSPLKKRLRFWKN